MAPQPFRGNFGDVVVFGLVMRLLTTAIALILLLPAAARADNPTPPAPTTGAATSVERTSATLTASVDPNGAATTYRFQYGTSTAYGLTTAEATVPAGDDPVTVSVPVAGLTEATTYHYRVTATNAAGVVNGADRTLTTASSPRPPSVSTQGATGVKPTSVTLTARVNPRGQATTVVFEYDTSTAYGATTAAVSAGSGTSTRTVRATVSGLKANTRYQYRVVATNATGTARGGNRSVVTLRAPTSASLSVPRSVRWNGSVTVTGQLRGSGIGGAPVALERSDFPYLTGYREVARQNASRSAAYRFTVGPLFSAVRLRVVTRTTISVTSPAVQVNNRVVPGIRVSGGNRRSVVLTGAINPAVPNARISVQRRGASGRWSRIATATGQPLAGKRTRYRVRIARTARASYVRVAVVPNDGGEHANGASRALRVAGRR